ncbi:DUF433 domain-containing protein [Prosthecobacter sp.]|uniref:DUF433 domain-containing protein n=1 Tax=Prosthecobacter sp. TaxID=1965333 RepID=UPI002ABA0C64|nr:DUF433 domain-containing protein [Prosthecobacter sp.]MDZ4401306.1 DUF433 domain-containing protein [Prosthecobacter sp.]
MPAQIMPHIWREASGEAWIDETPYKVAHLVAEHLAHGWSAETLHENHPDLTLVQIYAALAWFYDHVEEMESQIQEREKRTEVILTKLGNTQLQQRLSRVKAS